MIPSARRQQGGNAETIFLVVCGALMLLAIALMVRHADDFEPLLDIGRAQLEAWREDFEAVRSELREAIEAETRPPREPEVPLIVSAARDGNAPAVIRLLAGGADPDARDRAGRTALMHAAAAGRGATARLLLQAGADPRLEDREGRTAAGLARAAGHAELAEGLERLQ